jgi:hypothetical protein
MPFASSTSSTSNAVIEEGRQSTAYCQGVTTSVTSVLLNDIARLAHP